jgi:hypothetical protein
MRRGITVTSKPVALGTAPYSIEVAHQRNQLPVGAR